MSLLKITLFTLAVGLAIHGWQDRHTTTDQPHKSGSDFISTSYPSAASFQSDRNKNDFIPFVMPADAPLGAKEFKSSSDASAASVQSDQSERGFVSILMPVVVPPGTVLILAPLNCPSEAAQRADDLEKQLAQRRIPTRRSASDSITLVDPTPEQMAALRNLVAILKGPPPTVLINGRGKANPSVDEVVAEYRNTQ